MQKSAIFAAPLMLAIGGVAAASDAPPVIAEMGNEYTVSINSGGQWKVIMRLPNNGGTYDFERYLDIDGDGTPEIVISETILGNCCPDPYLHVLKIDRAKGVLVDMQNPEITATGQWGSYTRDGRTVWSYRIPNELKPGAVSEWGIAGGTTNWVKFPPADAMRARAPSAPVPASIRGTYSWAFGYCRPYNFRVEDGRIVWVAPNAVNATVTGVEVSAAFTTLTTDMTGPYAVVRIPNSFGSDYAHVSWDATKSGSFSTGCDFIKQ